MNRLKRTVLGSLTCLCAGSAAFGITPEVKESPYGVIVDRNVFDLREPPSQTTTETNTAPVAANIKLAGITMVLGQPRVLLQVQEQGPTPPGGRPPPPGKQESYILQSGQAQGPIEILEVKEKEGRVKIKNSGTEMWISFDTHGTKLTNVPLAGNPAAPGALPTPGGRPPVPQAGVPGAPAASATPASAAVGPLAVGGAETPGANTAIRNVPSRPLRMNTAGTASQPQLTPQQEVDLATQYLLIEKNRQDTQPQVDAGELPPLPPTPLNPPADQPPATP